MIEDHAWGVGFVDGRVAGGTIFCNPLASEGIGAALKEVGEVDGVVMGEDGIEGGGGGGGGRNII